MRGKSGDTRGLCTKEITTEVYELYGNGEQDCVDITQLLQHQQSADQHQISSLCRYCRFTLCNTVHISIKTKLVLRGIRRKYRDGGEGTGVQEREGGTKGRSFQREI